MDKCFIFFVFAFLSFVNLTNGYSDWWTHGVFYQIYPRSFKDSNNDGVGDLRGVLSKLNYLKDTGITGVWLSPIYKSPQIDGGYDISDYRDIHCEYGTLRDFNDLIKKANEIGLKIIMDLVPNHTSDQHKWFELSKSGHENYKDYYVWKTSSNGPPTNWISVFKYSAWKFSEQRNQYYLHQFLYQQPDLNYRNQRVIQEIDDVMKFWLDKGVHGFRVDALPFMVETFKDEPLSGDSSATSNDWDYLSHNYTLNQPETYDLVHHWRSYLDKYSEKEGGDRRIMMSEAYTDIEHTMLYYGSGTEKGAHFTFNFFLISDFKKDLTATHLSNVINNWLGHIPPGYVSNWVLGNHDNHRVATRFGKENVDGFNMLVTLLPGIAITYNGEEIGMEDGQVTWKEGKDSSALNGKKEDFASTSRDFERTPYQWDSSVNAGFNTGGKTWLPVSKKYLETNLKSQLYKKSHYTIYKRLLEIRKRKVFAEGRTLVEATSTNTIIIKRHLNKLESILLFNLGNVTEKVNLHKITKRQNLRVVVSSVNSKHKPETILHVKNLKLHAHESIVVNLIQ